MHLISPHMQANLNFSFVWTNQFTSPTQLLPPPNLPYFQLLSRQVLKVTLDFITAYWLFIYSNSPTYLTKYKHKADICKRKIMSISSFCLLLFNNFVSMNIIHFITIFKHGKLFCLYTWIKRGELNHFLEEVILSSRIKNLPSVPITYMNTHTYCSNHILQILAFNCGISAFLSNFSSLHSTKTILSKPV